MSPDNTATDLALLLLRVVLGGVLLAHGVNHLVGGGKVAGTGRWFQSMGMRPGIVHAWLASVTEIGAGLLLVAGLLNPLAAAGGLGVMLVAWIINHRGNGFFIFRPGEGWEYVMTLAGLSLAVATLGPGRWSLDHALDLADDLSGWTGLAVAAALGGGGAALLLACCWRPDR